jgi:LPS-assembly protein
VSISYRSRHAGESACHGHWLTRLEVGALALTFFALVIAVSSTPGNAQILMQADEIVYDAATETVTARGNVEISEPGWILRAETVTYNPDSDIVGATGAVSLTQDDGTVAFADEVQLAGNLREGALRGFAALIGENGRMAAITAQRREGRYTEARGAVFTSCKICAESGDTTPVWQITSERVVHDQIEKELLFEDATLEFLGVPVAYLPVWSQPDPTVKYKSGLLLPTVGSSSYLGTFARVPYYISMGPSRDATVEPYFTSGSGFVSLGEFRQRFRRGGFWLQGSLGTDPDSAIGPDSSEFVGHLFGSGRYSFGNNWRIGADAELTSNDTYLYRYDISYIDRLSSSFFVENVSGRNRFAATTYYFQSLREGDSQGGIPLVLPLIEYTFIPEQKFYGGRARIDSNLLYLKRDSGTDMARGSLSANWMRQFISDGGQVLSLDILSRGDFYHVNDAQFSQPDAPFDSKSISRGLGYAALEWRWPFVGQAGFGESALVVEPIVQVVAATGGGNPAGLPNEDSTTFEFDETNLFYPNEFPGLDLWTGGPRSNVGVRATAFFDGGSVEAILGQEFRARRDPNFAPGSGVGDTRSDIVGRLKIQFAPYINLTHRFRIDPTTFTVGRNEVYLTASYGRSRVDLSFLKLSPETTDPSLGPREELNLAGIFNVVDNWSVFADTRLDLQADEWLDAGFGLRYEDECLIAQVGFRNRRATERDLRSSTSVIVRIGLKTGFVNAVTP